RAINRVFKEASRDDQILIYYSGHGKLDAAGHLHLATYNTDVDTLETSSIAIGTLRQLIDNYACKQVALILDCCFGGAVGKDFLKSGVDDHLKQTFHGRGIYILTASTATQTAREKEGDDYSLFTKHILQGIRQGEADHDDDGLISLDDLYEYVKTRVPKEAPQYPTKWEFGVQGDRLFIARAARTFSPERLRVFKQKIKDDEDSLLPEVFEQAYRVIRENQPKRDKDFFALLEELCDGRARHGEFNSRWLKLGPAGAPEQEKKTPPQREKESQKLIASGADLEWFLIKESIQKKKRGTPTPAVVTPPQQEKAPLSDLEQERKAPPRQEEDSQTPMRSWVGGDDIDYGLEQRDKDDGLEISISAERRQMLDLEISHRITSLPILLEDSFTYTQLHTAKGSVHGKAEQHPSVGKLGEFDPLFSEFQGRSLFSLIWELRQIVAEKEKKVIGSVMESAKRLPYFFDKLILLAPVGEDDSKWQMDPKFLTQYTNVLQGFDIGRWNT